MLIYGAGGHAKVVMSMLLARGERISGIFDNNRRDTEWCGIPILGNYDPDIRPDEPLIIAIGNNHDRRKVSDIIAHCCGSAIHPSAMIDATALAEAGVVVAHYAVIQADCRIGNHVIVNTAAIVDHECELADFVHIGPGATLCGGVRVGECTMVGAGSVVLPGVRIGKECIVGAGSVVLRDVPDFTKVAGNPARIIN